MAAESSFTPDGSRRYRPGLISAPLIRQNYVSIPKKQQILLDRDDAWSGNLRGGSHGFVNVPPEVLEDVKAAHARQQTPRSQRPSSSPQHSSPPIQKSPVEQLQSSVKRSARCRSRISPSPIASQEVEEEDSDEGSAVRVPWSSSPPRQRLRSPGVERPSDKETDTQTTPSKGGSSPPRPIRDATRSRFLTEFPSSAIEEPDLELEEPGMLNQQPNLVNKPARLGTRMPEPTPPSAQLPVIPCSYNHTSSPDKPQRAPRSGLMKALKFDKSKSRAQPLGPDTTKLQPVTAEAGYLDSNVPSATRIEDDVSRKPRAIPVLATAAPTFAPPSYESSKIPETSPFQKRQTSSPKIQSPINSAVIQESSLEGQGGFYSQPIDKETIEDSASESSPSQDISTPWDAYKKAYPDFYGTVGDFVRACMCVQDLQTKRALPVFLYDDFIRAFAKDYLTYIGSLEFDDDSQPLTAVQWYNENVDNPVYNKSIINRQNLEVILITFPDEVRSAGLLIGSSDGAIQPTQTLREPALQVMDAPIVLSDTSSSDRAIQPTQTFPDPAPQVMHEPIVLSDTSSSEDAIEQNQTFREPATQVMEEATFRHDSPELSLPPARTYSTVEDVQEEVLNPPLETVAVVRPPVASPKPALLERRQELYEELHKHLHPSPSPGPRPPASSTASFRSRKRRSMETPEQRSKRLKAFLEKRSRKK